MQLLVAISMVDLEVCHSALFSTKIHYACYETYYVNQIQRLGGSNPGTRKKTQKNSADPFVERTLVLDILIIWLDRRRL